MKGTLFGAVATTVLAYNLLAAYSGFIPDHMPSTDDKSGGYDDFDNEDYDDDDAYE